MYVYFDSNVLIELVRADIDQVTLLADTEFLIAVTPDLAAEYQQAVANENVPLAERKLCERLLVASKEVGIFGFGEAGSGYSGLDHGVFATAEMATSIASTPITDRPGKSIPKNRTDAFLAALAQGAIVVTNDTGGHWRRARSAGRHVYSWTEIANVGAPLSDEAMRLGALLLAHL